MPTTTARAALRTPIGTEANDVVTDMAHLAQDADDAFAMLGQGLIAGRPAASKQRRMYYATDDRGGKLWYDTGAAWFEVGPGPVAGPMTGYTGLIVSAASAALADVTLGVRAKASQTGDLFDVQDTAGTTHHVRISITGNLITTQSVQGVATANYFGANAAGASGTRVRVGSEGDANNAYVSAEGSGTNVGLILRGKGATGSIVFQPTSGATVLTAAPALVTSAVKITVTAGGMDVAGSPSASYSDEIRGGTVTSGATFALVTQATGSPRQYSDHRGTSNTGDWVWRNGTNAANTMLTLSGSGLLGVVGGLDIGGSQTGFGGSSGEIRFPATTSGTINYINTMATGSPRMGFQHYGSGNTGDFMFLNGTAGGTLLFQITNTGKASAFGGVDVSGTPTGGYTGELRFPATTASGSLGFTTLATGTPTTSFDHRATSNTGQWVFRNGTSGATVRMSISGAGLVLAGGGVDVSGSPTGYEAEVRSPITTASAGFAFTTLATGTPSMNFDHRATSNTGQWVWRNGTGAASTRMNLSGAGLLNVTGGIDVQGSPSGYTSGEIRFPTNNGSGDGYGIATMGGTNPVLAFDHRASSNAGSWIWRNGTSGAATQMALSGIGDLTVTRFLFTTGGVVDTTNASMNFRVSGTTLMQLVPWASLSAGMTAIDQLVYKTYPGGSSTTGAVYVGAAGSGPGGVGQAMYVL